MRGTQEIKMRLKKPMVERKWATSPKLALPRNILNSTWMVMRQTSCLSSAAYLIYLCGLLSHFIKSWSGGWAHSQCHTHKGITMETVRIRHHDDSCDGHDGGNNLNSMSINETAVLLLSSSLSVSELIRYIPGHPWSGPWGQSRTREKRRLCGNSKERRHQWRSASSRPRGTSSWSASTEWRKVPFASQKASESSLLRQTAYCTLCQKTQTLIVFTFSNDHFYIFFFF